MANKHAGEGTIKLGGVTYTLRPSFGALAKIESLTGVSIIQLAAQAAQAHLRLTDIAHIILCVAEESGHEVSSLDQIGAQIVEEGIPDVIGPIAQFLAEALAGGREGNGAAAARKKTTHSAASSK